jgi:hypothetical protein
VFIVSHQYALLWLLGDIFVQKERALEITENPRPDPQRKKRSRLSTKVPERIMVGIIASDNSELMV